MNEPGMTSEGMEVLAMDAKSPYCCVVGLGVLLLGAVLVLLPPLPNRFQNLPVVEPDPELGSGGIGEGEGEGDGRSIPS